MRLFSHIVASAFLVLVGVSLALAHRKGLNPRAFWRRFAIVAGAAALVTAGSFVFAPSEPITFGILHCIAIASLLAWPFVKAPAWASLAVGFAAIAAPWLGRSTLFDPPWLLWLGLGEALPNTLDWRPLLPWAGVVFLGLGVARLPGVLERLTSPKRWRARSAPSRAICLGGRHSLPVYLVHQPILIGLLWVLTAWGPLAPKADMTGFLASCQRACVAQGRPAPECETGCRCVADAVVSCEATGWRRLAPSAGTSSSGSPTPAWVGEPARLGRARRRSAALVRLAGLMEWMPPPDGIAMCQGGDVCASHE